MALLDNPVVREFFETDVAVTARGERVAVHSQIPLAWAEALFGLVVRERPAVCVEVGMAFGASALAILAALEEVGAGELISVDPNQTTQWEGAGVETARRAGFAHRHRLVEEPSYLALPGMVQDGLRVDVAYVDGWHTFDYTLVDFFYLDKLLPVGGVIAFNDCHYPSVHRAIGFLLTHRRYEELDVGLPVRRVGYRRRARLKARVMRRDEGLAFRRVDDRYFRKLEAWEPDWDFYASF
jgi:predicted O-methyltransferase YrrM